MRGGLCDKQTSTLSSRSYSTVKIVDQTSPVIHVKAIGRESRCLPTQPALDVPIRGFPSEYCHYVWYGKPEWYGYPTVKKILQISLLISTEYTNVTDGQTDGRTDTTRRHMPLLCIISRGKKCKEEVIGSLCDVPLRRMPMRYVPLILV